MPCFCLKSLAKWLTSFMPLKNDISFIARKVLRRSSSACCMRKFLAYCLGDRPICCLNSCRNLAHERFTLPLNSWIESWSSCASLIMRIAAVTLASIGEKLFLCIWPFSDFKHRQRLVPQWRPIEESIEEIYRRVTMCWSTQSARFVNGRHFAESRGVATAPGISLRIH
jgi:hypothetical protein